MQEKRLILWLVSAISPDDTSFRNIRVSIKELADFIGYSGNGLYEQMVIVTKRLMERVLKVWNDDEGKTELFHWISYASYEPGDNGQAKLSLSNELIPYLLQLKSQFTKMELRYAITL